MLAYAMFGGLGRHLLGEPATRIFSDINRNYHDMLDIPFLPLLVTLKVWRVRLNPVPRGAQINLWCWAPSFPARDTHITVWYGA